MRKRRPDKAAPKVVLFAGPTLAVSARAKEIARACRLRPPVKRGDIAAFVAKSQPCALAIVDGVFHDSLAVGHAEIRDAIAAGFTVFGLSSMGAIRAREMRELGMRGFGRVFERFCQDDDFQDDEVALLHAPEPPYRAVSEPLIHLRAALAHLAQTGVVGSDHADSVVADLKSRWYGERTVRGTLRMLSARAGVAEPALTAALGDFAAFRWKTRDLEAFVHDAPWHAARTEPPTVASNNSMPRRSISISAR